MPSEYAPSVNSESTTYSTSKTTSSKPKRSLRKRVKSALADVGSPPTAKYDAENGRKPHDYNNYSGGMSTPSRI